MNAQIFEQAANWIINHRETGLDPQQKRAFDVWLRESPQHVRAYLEMSAVWEDVPALDPGWNPPSEQLIASARSEVNVSPLARAMRIGVVEALSPSRVKGDRLRVRFVTFAATICSVILTLATWHWLHRDVYATDIGEQRSLVLADGSTVELNSRSRIRIRYSDSQRDIDLLEGQALFRVAHDAARPFMVHSGTIYIRAVGTQFDVYRKRSGAVVTVVEGKVAVVASAVSAQLAAGERLIVPAVGTLMPHRANVAAATATAWTHRTLVLESSPLAEVAEEFNRYNTRQLIIADAELADIRISGMFSSVDPTVLLKFLRAQPELAVEERGTGILISKRRE